MGVERLDAPAPVAPAPTSGGFAAALNDVAPDTAPAPAPEAAPAPLAEPPAAPQLADAPPADPAPAAPEPDTFPRSYVEDLRRENANYRQRAQAAEAAAAVFEGWHPDDRAFVEQLLKDTVANPAAAAANWQHAAQVFAAYGEPMPGGIPGDPADLPPAAAPAGLTIDDLNRVLDQRDQQQRAQQQRDADVARITDQAKQLGYNTDLDAHDGDYVKLLNYANYRTSGDLNAAHELVQAERQAVIDAYLAQQAQAAGQTPTPTPTGAGPMPQGQPIANLKDSRRAFEAFLDQQLGPRPSQV